MEFTRSEPNPAQEQIINRLVSEGFIPPIEPTMPIEMLVESNQNTINTLHAESDFCQRLLIRTEDARGHLLTALDAAEVITRQKRVLAEIQRLRGIGERLMIADNIVQHAIGEPLFYNPQVVVEGSPFLTVEERTFLRGILSSEPIGIQLEPLDDIDFATQVMQYQLEAEESEAAQYGRDSRVELAKILTETFDVYYEQVPGFRDVCSIARNIFTRRNNPTEAQLVALLIEPLREAARRVGLPSLETQRLLTQLYPEAADMSVDEHVQSDDIAGEVETYLAQAGQQEEDWPISEADQAYETYELTARQEYLERFRQWGMIPQDLKGNELSYDETQRLFYQLTAEIDTLNICAVAAAVAWKALDHYGDVAEQMYGIQEVFDRLNRHVKTRRELRFKQLQLKPITRAKEIYYFIDKFIFLDAVTGVSEQFAFENIDPVNASYDCRELLRTILDAPAFRQAEIQQLHDYFAERYAGHYSVADDVAEIERSAEIAQENSQRMAEINRLKMEYRVVIDSILAATHHDRFSSHDDWRPFVRSLHLHADVLSMISTGQLVEDSWGRVIELSNRLGFERSELDRIHQRLMEIER